MEKGTLRQLEFARAIYDFQREHGFAPSISDLMVRLDISSKSVVWYWLRNLQRAGLITLHDSIARSAILTPAGEQLIGVTSCPHCGRGYA